MSRPMHEMGSAPMPLSNPDVGVAMPGFVGGARRRSNVGNRPTTPDAVRRSPWNLLRRAWQCTLFYVLLAHLGAMSLTWNFASMLIHPLLPRRQGLVVGRAAISSVYRGFWRFAEWLGLMRLDDTALDILNQDAGLIIAANHPCMLDALLVIARVPRGICIMRASLMRNPFLSGGARLARYIRNEPPRAMIRSAVANLRAGGQLVLFPEGTRTVQTPINPFRPGITLIAQMAQVPIQTVLIESESPYLCKGWPIWRAPSFPIVVRLRLGRRFAPEPDHAGLLMRLEDYFAAELTARAGSRTSRMPRQPDPLNPPKPRL